MSARVLQAWRHCSRLAPFAAVLFAVFATAAGVAAAAERAPGRAAIASAHPLATQAAVSYTHLTLPTIYSV